MIHLLALLLSPSAFAGQNPVFSADIARAYQVLCVPGVVESIADENERKLQWLARREFLSFLGHPAEKLAVLERQALNGSSRFDRFLGRAAIALQCETAELLGEAMETYGCHDQDGKAYRATQAALSCRETAERLK